MVKDFFIHASKIEYLASIFFFFAIVHTFFAYRFEILARKVKNSSLLSIFLHLLSEVELVFGLWSFIFLVFYFLFEGPLATASYLKSLNFREPIFVFVIMCMSATRPIIAMARGLIVFISNFLPFSSQISFYAATLVIGPLLGSFITEPAAMTVTALILLEEFFQSDVSINFKYATLALLFVNVSIGGSLTHFAAPPVLMVASKWSLTTPFMFFHFGVKAIFAIVVSTTVNTFIFKEEINKLDFKKSLVAYFNLKRFWKKGIHLAFLFLVVYFSHHIAIIFFLFIAFLGFIEMTKKYQEPLKIKESFLVAIFLAGLICLGQIQAWWLVLILNRLSDIHLYLGATTLTAFTDNAALTYLGSLVNLSENSRYALLAGALAGGGLTVIANAPNPAGLNILRESFGEVGIHPVKLFKWALIPTIISLICFWTIPHLS